MNKRLAGLLAFGISGWGASITWNDFRTGRARLWASGGVIPFEARRDANPAWFWGFTAVNAALILLILVASLVLIVRPGE